MRRLLRPFGLSALRQAGLIIEKPNLPLPGLRQFAADFGPVYLASGLVAFVFAASGPIAILLSVGLLGGLS